ncbi:MAG: 23S rRNA (pseudouridine(1915)-N(3))-methyltransferase RlmH [Deltaproteobacteria bacterium]|nr:23S rRNA (pseudouridine(1915)-N(3))-methyltransferase RlmH [Deltaproteobacteria bacterium]
MQLHILSEGREKADPAAPLVADYINRIAKFSSIHDTVVRPGAKTGLVDKCRHLCAKGLLPIALDERGREYTSQGFSTQLSDWMTRSPSGLLFVIGGAEGLPPEIRQIARNTIALSQMTFPHRFARLILAEQIYRALCIQKSIPYHK